MANAVRTTTKVAPARRPLGREVNRVNPEIITVSDEHRPFRRINFYLMAGCVCMIILGFLLMLGAGSSIEGGFNPDVFSTRRIVVGPALTFLGFLLMAFAIIYGGKRHTREQSEQPEVK